MPLFPFSFGTLALLFFPSPAGTICRPVAIVTGPESGIGRETARLLCEAGAVVVLNGRQPDRLEHTRQMLAAARLSRSWGASSCWCTTPCPGWAIGWC